MAKTTTQFLADVKSRITMPANQVLVDDARILAVGNGQLETDIVKLLVGSKQNYMVKVVDVPIVADQDEYELPYRSISGGLRDLKFLYSSDSSNMVDLPLIDIEDLQMMTNNNMAYPKGFYFRDELVVLVPKPVSASGSLRLWYYQYPSKMCVLGDAGQITNIVGDTVTVDNAPSTFAAGFLIDFVRGNSLTTTLAIDIAITNVSGTQLTFATADIPSRLSVGDWVSPAFETPLVPIPDTCNHYFEGVVAAQILRQLGDYEAAAALQKEVDDDQKDVKALLEPRTDGEIDKIVNYSGLLRQKTWRRFGTFRF